MEDQAKAIQSLREEISLEEEKGGQLETLLRHETKLDSKLHKLGRRQAKPWKQIRLRNEARAEVVHQSRKLQQVEQNIALVKNQNDKHLDCVQNIAERLEQHGVSWTSLTKQQNQQQQDEEKNAEEPKKTGHTRTTPCRPKQRPSLERTFGSLRLLSSRPQPRPQLKERHPGKVGSLMLQRTRSKRRGFARSVGPRRVVLV